MAGRVNELLADLMHCSGDHSCELCKHCDNGNFMCIDNLAADAAVLLQEYVDRCKRYADEIITLREERQWIPVTERLPKDEKPVLTFVGYADTMHGFITVSTYFALDPSPHWQWDGLVADRAQKTLYWMPLPPAPEVTCDG